MKIEEWKLSLGIKTDQDMTNYFLRNLRDVGSFGPVSIAWCPKCFEVLNSSYICSACSLKEWD